jgi:CHAT domain-containing protein
LAVGATGQSRDLYLAPGRLRTLAELELRLGHTEKASELYQRATDIVEGILVYAPDKSAKLAVLTEMSPVFTGHFKLAAQLNRPSLGFRIIEQVRGRIVAESLLQPTEREADDPQTEDAIRRLKVQLVRTDGASQRHALLDQLFFAEQARWTGLSRGNFHRVDPAAEITLRQVQGQLQKGEVILEYVLGDTESFCLKISASSSLIVKISPRKKIEMLAEAYLRRLKARKELPDDGHELFATLIEPLSLGPADTSIVIVPDGVLHLVPFGALRQNSGSYIASDHTIWYLPSAGALPLLRRARGTEPPRLLLAVGGVQYDDSPESFLLSQTSTALDRAIHREGGAMPMHIPNLPGTQEEIRAAASVLGASDARLIAGRQGTETEFKSALLNQFRIIHLAIHGEANTKNPDRAALVFRPDPPTDDGLLETREILGLHLNADLVVLSACDTAVGHLQGEEGVANLSRAFLVAGSKSVISTLWSIDDTYSLFLMKHFYIHLREGISEAEALRLSQTDLLHKFGNDTPAADWAAFTLLGDGDLTLFAPKRQLSFQ